MNIWLLLVLFIVAGFVLFVLFDYFFWNTFKVGPAMLLTVFAMVLFWLFIFYIVSKSPYEAQGTGKLINTYKGVESVEVFSDDTEEVIVSFTEKLNSYKIATKVGFVSEENLKDGERPYVEIYEISAKHEWNGIYCMTTEKMVKIYLPESESEDDVVSVVSGFCTNCGTGIESHYKFCPDCGFKVED